MHHVVPVGIRQRQLVREVAGAVRAAVVDDEDVYGGKHLVHTLDDKRQVLAFVGGGDDGQRAPARRGAGSLRSSPRDGHVAPLFLPPGLSRRMNHPLCSIATTRAEPPTTISAA